MISRNVGVVYLERAHGARVDIKILINHYSKHR